MSKIKVGKRTRRVFTLTTLLACLTLVTPPAPALASGYQLSGTVYYWFSETLRDPPVAIYKWNGSSWALHGVVYGDACGNYTYDTGGPGEFMGIVEGFNTVNNGFYECGQHYYNRTVSGSYTAEVSSANPSAYMDIHTTD